MYRVLFFQVQDSLSKLKKIVERATFHFQKKEHFLIFVEDENAQKFVSDLLWKNPPVSFLPHTLSDEKSDDYLIVTKSKKNLNGAKYAFNLCRTALFLEEPLKIIYEFEDLSAPAKKNLSSIRFDAYKKANLLIEASTS